MSLFCFQINSCGNKLLRELYCITYNSHLKKSHERNILCDNHVCRRGMRKDLIKFFMEQLYINITHTHIYIYVQYTRGILIVLYQREAQNVGGGEMEMKANGVRS